MPCNQQPDTHTDFLRRGPSQSVLFTLPLPQWNSKDKKCCLCKMPNVAAPVRVLGDVIAKTMPYNWIPLDAPTRTRNFSWFMSDEFLRRPVSSYQDYYVSSLGGGLKAKVVLERTTYCAWGVQQQVPSSVSSKMLRSDMVSTSLKNSVDQDGCKKGTPSNQPQLTRITSAALLGSWVLQPIKEMMSLATDFETHANWQGYCLVCPWS